MASAVDESNREMKQRGEGSVAYMFGVVASRTVVWPKKGSTKRRLIPRCGLDRSLVFTLPGDLFSS